MVEAASTSGQEIRTSANHWEVFGKLPQAHGQWVAEVYAKLNSELVVCDVIHVHVQSIGLAMLIYLDGI